jgi:hypothetical protein
MLTFSEDEMLQVMKQRVSKGVLAGLLRLV